MEITIQSHRSPSIKAGLSRAFGHHPTCNLATYSDMHVKRAILWRGWEVCRPEGIQCQVIGFGQERNKHWTCQTCHHGGLSTFSLNPRLMWGRGLVTKDNLKWHMGHCSPLVSIRVKKCRLERDGHFSCPSFCEMLSNQKYLPNGDKMTIIFHPNQTCAPNLTFSQWLNSPCIQDQGSLASLLRLSDDVTDEILSRGCHFDISWMIHVRTLARISSQTWTHFKALKDTWWNERRKRTYSIVQYWFPLDALWPFEKSCTVLYVSVSHLSFVMTLSHYKIVSELNANWDLLWDFASQCEQAANLALFYLPVFLSVYIHQDRLAELPNENRNFRLFLTDSNVNQSGFFFVRWSLWFVVEVGC